MTWTLTLERLPMSMNERERAAWWVRKRELDDITTEIGWLAKQQRIPEARGKRFVHVTIHKSIRSRIMDDPANLHARAKSILDALVRCRLLVDDNHLFLDWGGVDEGEKRATEQTVVVIADTAPSIAA